MQVSDLSGSKTADARPLRRVSSRDQQRLVQSLLNQRFSKELELRSFSRSSDLVQDQLHDLILAGPGEIHDPDTIFAHLRWGGMFVCLDSNADRIAQLTEAFDDKAGFVIEQQPTYVWHAPFGLRLPIPGLATRGHYFVARKTQLIQPGDMTDRFTYNVQLATDETAEHGYVVRKQVPTRQHTLWRLKRKFPDVDPRDLADRAHKLVDHVFPTFLTREAAMLQILQEHLPAEYRSRVPRVVRMEKDGRGFVRRLDMNWLRTGGQKMSQLEFARQAAELLVAVHEQARVIHLDLRLDNFVITDQGVGFVDFGSAVRIGEQIERSTMLNSLFEEMMRTSQIQRMLGRMLEKGQVTSKLISEVHGKVDKMVDSFYLAVQINRPLRNPEFMHLIDFDASSDEAQALASLTAAILRPKHPDKADFKAAADILRGIKRIEQRLIEKKAA